MDSAAAGGVSNGMDKTHTALCCKRSSLSHRASNARLPPLALQPALTSTSTPHHTTPHHITSHSQLRSTER